jgi:hypothetical protein
MLFHRLLGYHLFEKKKKTSGPQQQIGEIIMEPQFKTLISDYNRYLGKDFEKYRQLKDKKPFYDEFLSVFEPLMGLHRGKRFKTQLPENVRLAY